MRRYIESSQFSDQLGMGNSIKCFLKIKKYSLRFSSSVQMAMPVRVQLLLQIYQSKIPTVGQRSIRNCTASHMCHSSTLLMIDNREMAQQFPGLDVCPCLWIGTIREVFQLSGTVPLEIDMLQRRVTSGAIANAAFQNVRAEIPSGPVDLVVSKLESSLMMSSSEHSRGTGHSSGGTGSTSSSDKGVTVLILFNHDQQYSIPFAHTNHFKYSFLPNSISLWNNSPPEAVNCTTLPMFKYYTLPLFL